MNNIIKVKYSVANNSVHATEPKKATSGSTGYDLFAAEKNILSPICVRPITLSSVRSIKFGNSSW